MLPRRGVVYTTNAKSMALVSSFLAAGRTALACPAVNSSSGASTSAVSSRFITSASAALPGAKRDIATAVLLAGPPVARSRLLAPAQQQQLSFIDSNSMLAHSAVLSTPSFAFSSRPSGPGGAGFGSVPGASAGLDSSAAGGPELFRLSQGAGSGSAAGGGTTLGAGHSPASLFKSLYGRSPASLNSSAGASEDQSAPPKPQGAPTMDVSGSFALPFATSDTKDAFGGALGRGEGSYGTLSGNQYLSNMSQQPEHQTREAGSHTPDAGGATSDPSDALLKSMPDAFNHGLYTFRMLMADEHWRKAADAFLKLHKDETLAARLRLPIVVPDTPYAALVQDRLAPEGEEAPLDACGFAAWALEPVASPQSFFPELGWYRYLHSCQNYPPHVRSVLRTPAEAANPTAAPPTLALGYQGSHPLVIFSALASVKAGLRASAALPRDLLRHCLSSDASAQLMAAAPADLLRRFVFAAVDQAEADLAMWSSRLQFLYEEVTTHYREHLRRGGHAPLDAAKHPDAATVYPRGAALVNALYSSDAVPVLRYAPSGAPAYNADLAGSGLFALDALIDTAQAASAHALIVELIALRGVVGGEMEADPAKEVKEANLKQQQQAQSDAAATAEAEAEEEQDEMEGELVSVSPRALGRTAQTGYPDPAPYIDLSTARSAGTEDGLPFRRHAAAIAAVEKELEQARAELAAAKSAAGIGSNISNSSSSDSASIATAADVKPSSAADATEVKLPPKRLHALSSSLLSTLATAAPAVDAEAKAKSDAAAVAAEAAAAEAAAKAESERHARLAALAADDAKQVSVATASARVRAAELTLRRLRVDRVAAFPPLDMFTFGLSPTAYSDLPAQVSHSAAATITATDAAAGGRMSTAQLAAAEAADNAWARESSTGKAGVNSGGEFAFTTASSAVAKSSSNAKGSKAGQNDKEDDALHADELADIELDNNAGSDVFSKVKPHSHGMPMDTPQSNRLKAELVASVKRSLRNSSNNAAAAATDAPAGVADPGHVSLMPAVLPAFDILHNAKAMPEAAASVPAHTPAQALKEADAFFGTAVEFVSLPPLLVTRKGPSVTVSATGVGVGFDPAAASNTAVNTNNAAHTNRGRQHSSSNSSGGAGAGAANAAGGYHTNTASASSSSAGYVPGAASACTKVDDVNNYTAIGFARTDAHYDALRARQQRQRLKEQQKGSNASAVSTDSAASQVTASSEDSEDPSPLDGLVSYPLAHVRQLTESLVAVARQCAEEEHRVTKRHAEAVAKAAEEAAKRQEREERSKRGGLFSRLLASFSGGGNQDAGAATSPDVQPATAVASAEAGAGTESGAESGGGDRTAVLPLPISTGVSSMPGLAGMAVQATNLLYTMAQSQQISDISLEYGDDAAELILDLNELRNMIDFTEEHSEERAVLLQKLAETEAKAAAAPAIYLNKDRSSSSSSTSTGAAVVTSAGGDASSSSADYISVSDVSLPSLRFPSPYQSLTPHPISSACLAGVTNAVLGLSAGARSQFEELARHGLIDFDAQDTAKAGSTGSDESSGSDASAGSQFGVASTQFQSQLHRLMALQEQQFPSLHNSNLNPNSVTTHFNSSASNSSSSSGTATPAGATAVAASAAAASAGRDRSPAAAAADFAPSAAAGDAAGDEGDGEGAMTVNGRTVLQHTVQAVPPADAFPRSSVLPYTSVALAAHAMAVTECYIINLAEATGELVPAAMTYAILTAPGSLLKDHPLMVDRLWAVTNTDDDDAHLLDGLTQNDGLGSETETETEGETATAADKAEAEAAAATAATLAKARRDRAWRAKEAVSSLLSTNHINTPTTATAGAGSIASASASAAPAPAVDAATAHINRAARASTHGHLSRSGVLYYAFKSSRSGMLEAYLEAALIAGSVDPGALNKAAVLWRLATNTTAWHLESKYAPWPCELPGWQPGNIEDVNNTAEGAFAAFMWRQYIGTQSSVSNNNNNGSDSAAAASTQSLSTHGAPVAGAAPSALHALSLGHDNTHGALSGMALFRAAQLPVGHWVSQRALGAATEVFATLAILLRLCPRPATAALGLAQNAGLPRASDSSSAMANGMMSGATYGASERMFAVKDLKEALQGGYEGYATDILAIRRLFIAVASMRGFAPGDEGGGLSALELGLGTASRPITHNSGGNSSAADDGWLAKDAVGSGLGYEGVLRRNIARAAKHVVPSVYANKSASSEESTSSDADATADSATGSTAANTASAATATATSGNSAVASTADSAIAAHRRFRTLLSATTGKARLPRSFVVNALLPTEVPLVPLMEVKPLDLGPRLRPVELERVLPIDSDSLLRRLVGKTGAMAHSRVLLTRRLLATEALDPRVLQRICLAHVDTLVIEGRDRQAWRALSELKLRGMVEPGALAMYEEAAKRAGNEGLWQQSEEKDERYHSLVSDENSDGISSEQQQQLGDAAVAVKASAGRSRSVKSTKQKKERKQGFFDEDEIAEMEAWGNEPEPASATASKSNINK